jgi:hypothetical protein
MFTDNAFSFRLPVIRIGPTPTEVVMPLGDNVNRTLGIGLKLFLKRHPMAYSYINFF